jgi:hypothetical protein
MYDLLALLCGDRCSSTFIMLLVFLAASSSSRRATGCGASSMSLGSFVVGVIRVNVVRLTQCLAWPNSFFSCVFQLSPEELHARWPDCVNVLLMYTHSFLSASVLGYVCCCVCGRVGIIYYGVVSFCCVGILGCVIFVVLLCLVLAVSLAITRSIWRRMMSCSLSMACSSCSCSCGSSGAFYTGSFPFFVVICAVCWIVFGFLLGPGMLITLAVEVVGCGVVVEQFRNYAMSTCISITAYTIFVGFHESGSRSAIL